MATQTDDPDPMLQKFLDVNGLTPVEVANRADLLEKLDDYHNLHLGELNTDQHNKGPIITLSEKCDLCVRGGHKTFSSLAIPILYALQIPKT